MNREPEISERFDINDIRRIREYNAARYLGMSPVEIVADTKAGAEKVLQLMEESVNRMNDRI
ncbi:MAG: hypothetical protein HFH39_06970 [Lachnospiraceae bacterium]|nr:hypothetical protein [Lachnospiraceae bacterium]